jgi:hypothetical protein
MGRLHATVAADPRDFVSRELGEGRQGFRGSQTHIARSRWNSDRKPRLPRRSRHQGVNIQALGLVLRWVIVVTFWQRAGCCRGGWEWFRG